MLGERIKKLRTARGWNQGELADRAGISTGMVSHIERGEKAGSVETIVSIAKAFSISPGLPCDDRVGVDRLAEMSLALDGMSHLSEAQLQAILQLISSMKSSG